MNQFFATPRVTRNLLIINALMFFATYVFQARDIDMDGLLGLHFVLAPDFHLYQLVTYMFMHANLEHIFFNMFALWMFGRVMESTWGERRYLAFYFICGIGAGLCQEVWQFAQYYMEGLDHYTAVSMPGYATMSVPEYLNTWNTIGASGAVYGVLLGFGMSYPEERILIFPIPVPIKAKWFVMGYAVIELGSAFLSNGNVAHFAHLGGMLFGWLVIRHWNKQRQRAYSGWNTHSPRRKNLFDAIRERLRREPREEPRFKERSQDYADNARQKANQEEIDRILDKVRRAGYSSLTEEEKKKLFDQSRRG